MNPDKYTAIAKEVVKKWNTQHDEQGNSDDDLRDWIAQAIADAVEAEKAKASVEWPSEALIAKKAIEICDAVPETVTQDRCKQLATRDFYDWLRSQAKIVWGE